MWPYSASELNERIAIERIARTPDGQGGYVQTWSAIATVWAMVRARSGTERSKSEQLEAPITYLVVIRYPDGFTVTPDDRITWRSRVFNIRFLSDQGPRSPWLAIDCDEGLGNG